MLQPGEHALALCAQGRRHQRRAAAQIRRRQTRAPQPLHAADPGQLPLHADVRAQAAQLRRGPEPVLEQGLLEAGHAASAAQGGHQQRLSVGGKAGVGRGGHAAHALQSAGAAQGNFLPRADGAARPPQSAQHRLQLPRLHAPQPDRASGGRRRAEVSRRHDAVGDDPMLRAVEVAHAVNLNHAAASAPHVGPHFPHKILQVLDFRLPRRIFEDGCSLSSTGGQHDVLRGAHAGHTQPQPRAPGSAPAEQAALVLLHRDPHGPEGLKVQVDGPRPQRTAPRQGHPGAPAAAQHRPQKEDGGAHLPHQVTGHMAAADAPGVHGDVLALSLHLTAQMPQNAHRGAHIGQVRAVVQHAHAAGEQRRGQNGQHAVLRPVDAQRPGERRAAPNPQASHSTPPFRMDLCYAMPASTSGFLGAEA